MARPIWSGSLSFGLVNIPVNLYSATGEERISFHLLHASDLSPINYARVCRSDGKEVPWEDVAKGYEYKKGDYVVLTESDFEKVNPKKTKTIDIVDFVEEAEIDPVYFETPYYLEPAKGAEKPYVLLRKALEKSKKVGVARFVLRNHENMAVIQPKGNALMLVEMRFDADLRPAKGLKIPDDIRTDKNEVELALELIEHLTSHFDPKKYKDEYSKELRDMLHKKAVGKTIRTKKGTEPRPTPVPDLLNKLKKSLEKHK